MVSQFYIPGCWLNPGQIYNPQGDIQFPTDNCFTEPGQKIDILTNGTTVNFFYYFRPESEITCAYMPVNPGEYDTIRVNSLLEPYNCFQFIEGTTIPSEPILNDLTDRQQLLAELAPHIESSIDTLLWYNEVWEEKEALLHYFVHVALDSNDITAAEQLIASENSIAAEWAIYGLRLSRGDVAGAAAWLQQMPSTAVEDQDFNDIQWINMAMRQDTTGNFTLDSVQHAWLEYMAEGGSPVRDYARSLLGLLTGQRFYPEIPEEEAELRFVEKGFVHRETLNWRIYPVPVSDELHLVWDDASSDDTNWQIRLTDLTGREILMDSFLGSAGRLVLNLHELRNGFYIAVVSTISGVILHSASIVVLR